MLRFSDSVHATATHWVDSSAREGSCERGMVGTLLENPPFWRNGLGSWGKRRILDLSNSPHPVWCDAQEKENSEKGDQNQNPMGQKLTWRWGKNLLYVGISGPSLWLISVALPACFTHQSQLQAGSRSLSWKSLPFRGFMESILLLSPWNYIILLFYLS